MPIASGFGGSILFWVCVLVVVVVVASVCACRCHPFESYGPIISWLSFVFKKKKKKNVHLHVAFVLLLWWHLPPCRHMPATAVLPTVPFSITNHRRLCVWRTAAAAAAAVAAALAKLCIRWSSQTSRGSRVNQLRVGGRWW